MLSSFRGDKHEFSLVVISVVVTCVIVGHQQMNGV